MILNAYLSFNYNIFLFLLNDEMIVNNTDFRFGQIDKKKTPFTSDTYNH